MPQSRVWLFEGDDEPIKRAQARNNDVRAFPRRMREAEIVCANTRERTPMLLVVVYPKGAPDADLQIMTEVGIQPFGADLEVDCRCHEGSHTIDGGLLRSAVLAHPRKPIDVMSVSVLE